MPTPGEDYEVWSKIAINNGTIDPPIDWHEGQARRTVNDSSRSELAAHAKHRDLNNGSIVTSGTANAQIFFSGVNYTSMPARLTATLKVGPGLTNNGVMTLGMDGMTPIQVVTTAGANLRGGEFLENQFVSLLYAGPGTNWILLDTILHNPILTGDPQAPTPSDPLDNDQSIANTHWVQELIFGGAGIVLAQRVFTASGVWVPQAGMKSCLIEAVGGGGGGGGISPQAGFSLGAGGGGGGGYARRFATATEVGASQNVVIGAGGLGGNPAGLGSGGNGSPTSVGTLCVAGGGFGAPYGNIGGQSGQGGVGTTGNFLTYGGAGDAGVASGAFTAGGAGGDSALGGGAPSPGLSVNGINAVGYGGGGSGGQSHFSAIGLNGGNGAPGAVVITEFAGAGQPGPAGPAGPVGPIGGSFPDAAADGFTYGRLNNGWNKAQPLDGDLTSIASASAIGQIYYRKAVDTWVPVTIGNGLSFTTATDTLAGALFSNSVQGTVPASGGGTVNYLRADGTWAVPAGGAGSGTITIGTTPISGGTSGNYLFDNASVAGEKTPTQVTADLNLATSTLKGLCPASGGGTVNFLRADMTWTTPGGAGLGNVSNSGTPTANQWAQWVDATHIQGVSTSGTPWVQKAGDTMTGLLTLSADPSTALQAATKQYVDAHAGIAQVKILTFTANGTYTPTAGMKHCLVEVIGGGGGGGAAVHSAGAIFAGGGGGSGGYSRKLCTAADIGVSKAVTIGTAGTAGNLGGTGLGGTGSPSSLGSLCVANGGSGGEVTTNASGAGLGGAGGTAGTGDVPAAGAPGAGGFWNNLNTTIVIPSGNGGSSILGGGAVGVRGAAGSAAGNYGSGGSGGHTGGAVGQNGGAGSAGICIITEYI